eukprot:g942.t1
MHTLDRFSVTEVKCLSCNRKQPVASSCIECGVSFGKYSCIICRLFDDDDSKQQYHCDGCGICRVGGRENFTHCYKCGTCYSNEGEHTCIENAMHRNCPVCMEFLFDSRKPCSSMRCGHTIHSECLEQLMRTQYKCPLCSASLLDRATMNEHYAAIDAEIAATIMPEEYRNTKVEILCNDCHQKSETRWHVLGLKCMAPLEVENENDETSSDETLSPSNANRSGESERDEGRVNESGSEGMEMEGIESSLQCEESKIDNSAVAAAPTTAIRTNPRTVTICGSYNTRRIR